MLGIGFPDRHALPRITPIKCADRVLRSPPARAGSFYGAARPLRRIPAIVSFLNPQRALSLGRGNASSCPLSCPCAGAGCGVDLDAVTRISTAAARFAL